MEKWRLRNRLIWIALNDALLLWMAWLGYVYQNTASMWIFLAAAAFGTLFVLLRR